MASQQNKLQLRMLCLKQTKVSKLNYIYFLFRRDYTANNVSRVTKDEPQQQQKMLIKFNMWDYMACAHAKTKTRQVAIWLICQTADRKRNKKVIAQTCIETADGGTVTQIWLRAR